MPVILPVVPAARSGPQLRGIEQNRLERAINLARWTGAVVVFGLGPVFPNLGWAFVVGLGVFLLLYAATMHAVTSGRRPHDLKRALQLAFWADNSVILFAMLIFSPDRPWTTFVFGILVIIIGGFRYGGIGALTSASLLGAGYVAIAVYREIAFGYLVEPERLASHVAAYLLAALLMSGIMRELQSLRGLFEPLLAAQGDLGEGIVVNAAGRPVYWNDAISRVTGYSGDELAALGSILDLVVPSERDAVAMALGDRKSGGKIETLFERKDGSRVSVELAFAPIDTAVGRREVILVRDVTESKLAWESLRDQALHDRLTGLANRTLLDDRLEQAVAAARRLTGQCSVLLLGLDNFSDVIEAFGHSAGDTLMPQVAGRISGEVRAVDTVARMSGDEFAVLLPATDTESASVVARKIVRAMERPFSVGDQAVGLGASVGIVTYPDHGSQPDELLRHGEIAMQAAKGSGQGFLVYTSGEEPQRNSLLLAPALRKAMQEDELVLHYQPEVSMADGRPLRMEALVRWRRGQELVQPVDFVPLAERRGLMGALTLWVLGAALRDRRAWAEAGTVAPAVAVNVSASNLLDPEFPSSVARLCTSTNTDPRWLALEITESVLMVDPPRTRETLITLRGMGIHLAIDDFGTGYSSLAYLYRLPMDAVKIDRSFITDLDPSSGNWAIVRATIDIARDFGLELVAEGVENQAMFDRLASMGVDTAQGYHIARPMALADTLKWLEQQRRTQPTLPLRTALRRT